MELEAEAADLERSIALAKQMEKPYEKERIIYTLEKLRNGDVKDKKYQRLLINTFVKAVYLWDDKIRIDYYYTGKRHSADVPVDIAADADMGAVPECSYIRSCGVPNKNTHPNGWVFLFGRARGAINSASLNYYERGKRVKPKPSEAGSV